MTKSKGKIVKWVISKEAIKEINELKEKLGFKGKSLKEGDFIEVLIK